MTLLETLLSAALTTIVAGAVCALVISGERLARTQPERVDLQQRARVAMAALRRDLRDVGAGFDHAGSAAPLNAFSPPIVPTVDGVTLWRITSGDAQAMLAIGAAPGATVLTLQDSPRCPVGQPACRFAAGDDVIAVGAGGCRIAVHVAAVSTDALQLAAPGVSCALVGGSLVAAGDVRTYRLDPPSRQLLRRNEATGSSAPLVGGVSSMKVEVYSDAAGAQTLEGRSDAELLHVRRVRITLRFAAANPLLHIADLDLVVDAAPRNLHGG